MPRMSQQIILVILLLCGCSTPQLASDNKHLVTFNANNFDKKYEADVAEELALAISGANAARQSVNRKIQEITNNDHVVMKKQKLAILRMVLHGIDLAEQDYRKWYKEFTDNQSNAR